jgi:hypothetical protein
LGNLGCVANNYFVICVEPQHGQVPINDLRLGGIEGNQLTVDDRDTLTKEFGLEEIKEVIFDLKHNKAAGLMG